MTEARDVLVKRLRDVAREYPGHASPDLLREAADALEAIPASDGLPEGWRAVAADRERPVA